MRRVRYEAIDGEDSHGKSKKNQAGNTDKLDSSLSRTKAKIFELAMCNAWEYFITLTLNKEYHDRKDLKTYKKKLSTWIKNYNRLQNISIKYLLIPEEHKDGNWHMHGLIMGLPTEYLREFTADEKLPLKMLTEITKGNTLYDWPAYAKAFGYLSISKIRNAESVSKYITKYITKNLLRTRISLNDHFYYASQGLKRAEIIYKGQLTKDFKEDFGNEYVKIKTLQTFDEAIQYFTDDSYSPSDTKPEME